MTVPHDAARCRVQSSGTAGNRCAMNRAEQATKTGIGRRKKIWLKDLGKRIAAKFRGVALGVLIHRTTESFATHWLRIAGTLSYAERYSPSRLA